MSINAFSLSYDKDAAMLRRKPTRLQRPTFIALVSCCDTVCTFQSPAMDNQPWLSFFHFRGLTSDNTVASLDTEVHPEYAFEVDSTAAPDAPVGTGKVKGFGQKGFFFLQFDAKSSTKTCLEEAEGDLHRSPNNALCRVWMLRGPFRPDVKDLPLLVSDPVLPRAGVQEPRVLAG